MASFVTLSCCRADCETGDAEARALASPAIIRYLDGKDPRKVIVVKNRIINVVI
jgi:leucyl-tRNA synthetase